MRVIKCPADATPAPTYHDWKLQVQKRVLRSNLSGRFWLMKGANGVRVAIHAGFMIQKSLVNSRIIGADVFNGGVMLPGEYPGDTEDESE